MGRCQARYDSTSGPAVKQMLATTTPPRSVTSVPAVLGNESSFLSRARRAGASTASTHALVTRATR
jgi:hypothetical protein